MTEPPIRCPAYDRASPEARAAVDSALTPVTWRPWPEDVSHRISLILWSATAPPSLEDKTL